MDKVIQIADLQAYIQRRRTYLVARRDTAEITVEKGKIIGMLQALDDFEGMISQLRVTPTARTPSLPDIPSSCDDLAARWLSTLALPGACIDDFRNDRRQNRAIALNPDKKEQIVVLGQLIRNKALIDNVFDQLRAQYGGTAVPTPTTRGDGVTCPFCGKAYKYAKALETHVVQCPKKISTSDKG